MSQAEELLAGLSNEYPSDPDEDPHIVIGKDRTVKVPDELKRIAVQYDHNVETVTFDCPRYWDEHDMSTMVIYINYRRPDGKLGMYYAKNVRVDGTDESMMHFDWTIERHVTEVKGNLAFLVCVKKADSEGIETNHWNSELCTSTYISEGMECEDVVTNTNYILITELLTKMDAIEKSGGGTKVYYVNSGWNTLYMPTAGASEFLDPISGVQQKRGDIIIDKSCGIILQAKDDYVPNEMFEVTVLGYIPKQEPAKLYKHNISFSFTAGDGKGCYIQVPTIYSSDSTPITAADLNKNLDNFGYMRKEGDTGYQIQLVKFGFEIFPDGLEVVSLYEYTGYTELTPISNYIDDVKEV